MSLANSAKPENSTLKETNQMTTALDQAIQQAQAAAQAVVPAAPVAQQASVPAAYAPPAQGAPMKLSNEDLMNSSMGVKGYIKVSEDGLKFGKDGKLVTDPVDTVIDLSEVVACFAIKSNTTPARYEKTYDGIVAASGKPWVQATAEIQQLTPSARPYQSAEIPFVITGELKAGGAVQAEDGDRFGYGLSTTNKDNWANFLRAVAKEGHDVNTVKVRCRIGAEARTGNGNTWGVMTFEYLGLAE